eukprot:3466936-Rhodomonas_salina.2
MPDVSRTDACPVVQLFEKLSLNIGGFNPGKIRAPVQFFTTRVQSRVSLLSEPGSIRIAPSPEHRALGPACSAGASR